MTTVPPTEFMAARGLAWRGRTGALAMDGRDLATLAARFGTPLYVYSARTVRRNFGALASAAGRGATIAYSVKANGSLALLSLLAGMGAHFDIVSGGELTRLVAIGVSPARVIFSGVGKSSREIHDAIRAGIAMFNVESPGEIERIDALAARLGRTARVALRVNPDVAPATHRYIATGDHGSKFGLPMEVARDIIARAGQFTSVSITGIHAHIGSQITSPGAYRRAAARIARFIESERAALPRLATLNMGGGFGIAYEPGAEAPDVAELAAPLRDAAARLGLALVLEPGRAIVGNAGILLTRVEYLKTSGRSSYVICDAAMTELIRPALYEAHHEIVPVRRPGTRSPVATVDVVGPVCETGDFLARGRRMHVPSPGDLLVVLDAGAYGASMASNYNTRPRPAEVLIDGASVRLVRKRESYGDLLRNEIP